MIYRVFTRQELPSGFGSEYINDKLAYVDDGAVTNFKLNDDYLSDTNSSFEITQSTAAKPKDIVALLEGERTVALGVITSVDNTAKTITFKSMLNIFNVDILNPLRSILAQEEDDKIKYRYTQDDARLILLSYFASASVDKEARYPLDIVISGEFTAIWNYTSNTINARQWLLDLFNDKNVVLQFSLIFEDDTGLSYIRIRLAKITAVADNIKDNVYCQEIISTEELKPKATVAWVLDKANKKLLSTWYLLHDNTVTQDATNINRVYPYLPKAVEYENKDGATQKLAAEQVLLNNLYRHQIKIKYSDLTSPMYPKDLQIGDSVKIISKDGSVFDSIYTGSEDNKRVLIFGKARTKFSDILLDKLKSRR